MGAGKSSPPRGLLPRGHFRRPLGQALTYEGRGTETEGKMRRVPRRANRRGHTIPVSHKGRRLCGDFWCCWCLDRGATLWPPLCRHEPAPGCFPGRGGAFARPATPAWRQSRFGRRLPLPNRVGLQPLRRSLPSLPLSHRRPPALGSPQGDPLTKWRRLSASSASPFPAKTT